MERTLKEDHQEDLIEDGTTLNLTIKAVKPIVKTKKKKKKGVINMKTKTPGPEINHRNIDSIHQRKKFCQHRESNSRSQS